MKQTLIVVASIGIALSASAETVRTVRLTAAQGHTSALTSKYSAWAGEPTGLLRTDSSAEGNVLAFLAWTLPERVKEVTEITITYGTHGKTNVLWFLGSTDPIRRRGLLAFCRGELPELPIVGADPEQIDLSGCYKSERPKVGRDVHVFWVQVFSLREPDMTVGGMTVWGAEFKYIAAPGRRVIERGTKR